MKDTLLITLGDSWTQGVGCYPENLKEDHKRGLLSMQDLFLQSFDCFQEHSWPSQTAKILNADLINLAKGGDANSATAKRLYSDVHEKYKESYKKVIVVFLLSDFSRFSFYNNKIIQTFMPARPNLGAENLCNAFLEHCLNDETDELCETAFYLKTVEYFSESCGYDFFYGSAFTSITQLNKIYFKPDIMVHNHYSSIRSILPNNSYFSELCGHPNEKGYELIGKFIGDYLTKR
jgi:lysophospholipase L1-like esterase